jgi:hypothetical protein
VLTAAWSKRRRQVEQAGARLIAEKEAAKGRSLSLNERAACFQVATYRTRAPKVEADTPTAELRARWTKEAEDWGHAPSRWLPGLTRSHQRQRKLRSAEILSVVVARLEDRSATWTRAKAVEVLSTLVEGESAEEVRETLEQLAGRLLRHPEVTSLAAPLPASPPESLRRRDGMALIERHGATRHTTKGTLAREAFILESAEKGREPVLPSPGGVTSIGHFAGPPSARTRRALSGSSSRVASRSPASSVPRGLASPGRLRRHGSPGSAPATARSALLLRRWLPASSQKKPDFGQRRSPNSSSTRREETRQERSISEAS